MEVMNQNRRLIKDRIIALIKALSNGIYERESTIRLCLLAALSGENLTSRNDGVRWCVLDDAARAYVRPNKALHQAGPGVDGTAVP